MAEAVDATRSARGVGSGGMLTFMSSCRSSWCYAHAGWGGGDGGDVNVHVKLQKQLMMMTMMMMMMMMLFILMMMMMMMTLMKLVNSETKIRPGIDKFYQPNSGLRSSKTEDKAIYIRIHSRMLDQLSYASCSKLRFDLNPTIQAIESLQSEMSWTWQWTLFLEANRGSLCVCVYTKISLQNIGHVIQIFRYLL